MMPMNVSDMCRHDKQARQRHAATCGANGETIGVAPVLLRLLLSIEVRKDMESHLLLSFVRDQALAIVEILYSCQKSFGIPEVHQQPWRDSRQERNPLEHRDL